MKTLKKSKQPTLRAIVERAVVDAYEVGFAHAKFREADKGWLPIADRLLRELSLRQR